MSSRFILPFADVGSGIKPSSGAQLFFFEAGTSTPQDTFSDQLSTPTANTNPVIADSTGLFGDIFISGVYKVILKDKNGSQIWTADPVDEQGVGSLPLPYIFPTISAYKTSPISFPVGKTIHLDDRNADFKVIAGTAGANDEDLIASTSVSQSIDLINDVNQLVASHFGVKFDGTDTSSAFSRVLEVAATLVTSFGTSGSTDGQPENLESGVKIILGQGIVRFSGLWEQHAWVSIEGSNTVIDVTGATMQFSPDWTSWKGVSFVSTTAAPNQVDPMINVKQFAGDLTTDVAVMQLDTVIFKGAKNAMRFTEAGGPHHLYMKSCRSVNCITLLDDFIFDSGVIDGGSFSGSFTSDDRPFIDNISKLYVVGAAFTPVDDLQFTGTGAVTPRTNYRWFDNFGNLHISNCRFGNELVNRVPVPNSDLDTPQIALVYNHADILGSLPTAIISGQQISATQANKSLIVENCAIFSRWVGMIKLFGLPAMLSIKSNYGMIGSRFGSLAAINITDTEAAGAGVFEVEASVKADIIGFTYELQRFQQTYLDLGKQDMPLLVGEAKTNEAWFMSLVQTTNSLPQIVLPRSLDTVGGIFAEWFFLADMLPEAWTCDIHLTTDDVAGKVVGMAGFRVIKRIFNNGGVRTSQLSAVSLYTQDWAGGIALGHNNTTTTTSTNLTPGLIGIKLTQVAQDKEKTFIKMYFNQM